MTVNDSTVQPITASPASELRRELGRWDLALLFVVAVLNLNTISSIAATGPVALWLWVVALLGFFLPQGLAVMELSHRYPGEGGLYLWNKEVFSDFHGFIAGWAYLATNVFYIPFVLLYLTGIGLYVWGPRAQALIDNPLIAFPAVLGTLFLITWVNVLGVGVGKWLNNVGGIGTLIAAAVLVIIGVWSLLVHGSSLHRAEVTRVHLDWPIVSAFGAMCFSLIGLELASVMGDEIRDPRRTLPAAITISGIACALFYLGTTAALLVAMPSDQIGVVQGLIEAISRLSQQIGFPWILPVTAFILSISVIGIASAWLTCSARLPFVFGLDHYLPAALGKVHPRYKTPYVALIAQSAVCALFLAMSFAGSAVKEAFVTMLDLSAVLNLVPYAFIFAAILTLANDRKPELRPPGRFRKSTLRVVGSVGLMTTLVGIAVVFVPSKQVQSVALFELKMFSGTLFFFGLGAFLFFRGRRKARRSGLHAG
jgi:glutamate:GABA antiporter